MTTHMRNLDRMTRLVTAPVTGRYTAIRFGLHTADFGPMDFI